MLVWQQIIISFFGISSLIFLTKAFFEIRRRKNIYGLTPYLFYLGAFVWGDMVILGPFWIGISIIALIVNNLYLFLLIVSIFWVIRSLGETIYWLNEQFALEKRNPPHTLKFHKIFKSDAIWFIYQLAWQCVLIVSIILSIYFTKLWLTN